MSQWDLEPDDEDAKGLTSRQRAKRLRSRVFPRLSVREPFWWSVASAIAMVLAFIFVLLVTRADV